MKGLLIKDIKLLKNQKSFFLMIVVFAFFFLCINNNPFFVVSYVTFISVLLVVNSMSYDEYNNANTFLFTLPITRKDYVVEKYLFGFLCACLAWVFTIIISIGYLSFTTIEIKMLEFIGTSFVIMMIAFVFMAVMIPVQLKFGQTKGNVAVIMCVGCLVVIGFIIVKLFAFVGIDILSMIDSLGSIGMPTLLGIMVLIVIVCMVVSYYMSLQIMNKKQF